MQKATLTLIDQLKVHFEAQRFFSLHNGNVSMETITVLEFFIREGMIYTYSVCAHHIEIVVNHNFPMNDLEIIDEIRSARQIEELPYSWGIVSTTRGLLTLQELRLINSGRNPLQPSMGGRLLVVLSHAKK